MYTKPETRKFGNTYGAKLWLIEFEIGKQYIISNLESFCRENRIKTHNLYSTVKSKKFFNGIRLIKKVEN
jgi:hypothetical protein